MSPRRYFHLAITLGDEDIVIGWCGLQFEMGEQHQAELGYALHRDYWVQGIATEAASALVDFGFTELDVHRVWGECYPENVGSIRVLQKIGMTR